MPLPQAAALVDDSGEQALGSWLDALDPFHREGHTRLTQGAGDRVRGRGRISSGQADGDSIRLLRQTGWGQAFGLISRWIGAVLVVIGSLISPWPVVVRIVCLGLISLIRVDRCVGRFTVILGWLGG